MRLPPLVFALAALPAMAHAGEPPPAEPAGVNHPPHLEPTPTVTPRLSDGSTGLAYAIRTGRETRVAFEAEDADGDPLSFRVTPLPRGATFDPERGVLTWRPSKTDEHAHQLTVVVSDGRLQSQHTYAFAVRENRPPDSQSETEIVRSARASWISVPSYESSTQLLQDPDGDDLTFTARQIPRGARLTTGSGALFFVWEPVPGDEGEHDLVVDVSDGTASTTLRRTIVVIPEWARRDYRRWFLLGGGPSAFLTHDDGQAFFGGTVDITLVALREDAMTSYFCSRGNRDRECHASHHRFYGQFEVLDSLRAGQPSLFTYGIGYSASLEWNPARRYLIPHYGLDVGGLVRAKLGHRAAVHPYLGLHLFAGEDFWIDATVGYRVTPAELLALSGPTAAVRVIVNPW